MHITNSECSESLGSIDTDTTDVLPAVLLITDRYYIHWNFRTNSLLYQEIFRIVYSITSPNITGCYFS